MSEQVSLTIDGREAKAAPGVTIYWAAKSLGIEIPHLCYSEELPPMSSCRLCVVEVDGMRSLAASCSLPVASGMVVRTDTERVRAARRMNLQLILSDHTIECITCEKSGSCALERYAYEFGIKESRFTGPRWERNRHPVDESNPFFVRDYDKCILCGRCVHACAELQFDSAIDYGARGFTAHISTPFGRPLTETSCEFCGRCISVCPVGALTEKARRGRGREWELAVTSTICPYCGCGCTLDMHVKAGRVVKVSTHSRDTVNRGNLCVKGKFGTGFLDRSDRLTQPLVRRDGALTPASWEEALELVARRFAGIKEAHGPDALAGLASAKCTNEENYVFQRFVRAVFATNNVDHCARLCHASTVTGLARAFGSGAMTNSIAELRYARCIFVTGSNTTEAHPIIALEIKAAVEKHGAALIVADPREIDLVRYAKIWLRHRSGTDVALLNGLMHVILAEGLEDRAFIDARTEDFVKLRTSLGAYTPERAASITGVPRELIVKAARLYASSPPAPIVYSMGITQHTTGTDNVLSLANLAMLTGNVGKRASGVNPLRGQNNVQGACDVGALPNVYPGYQPVANEAAREKFSAAWGAALSLEPGLTAVEILHHAGEGKIRGLYIMGENPFLSDPNANRTRLDLSRLEFLVVQDIFLTETAEFAHVVLPAAAFAEKDGTFTNSERRVQLLRKVTAPPGEAREDWRIVCDVAARMGHPMRYESSRDIMDELARLTPIYGGISHARIARLGLQWPCPDETHPGTPILHEEVFSRGKGLFHAVEYRPPAEEPDREYPLLLTTGRILYHYHTGTMTRRVQALHEMRPHGVVEINPEDAQAIGCADGELVEVSSRRGTVSVRCVATRRSRPGSVFMAFHFAEAAANLLTNDALDPDAKIPEYKVCAVRIRRLEGATASAP
jgi:formate dehydrogenase alpha subunit